MINKLEGVFWTGGSLNPARSFGPAVVVHAFERYHWIYWVGPMTGSLLAVVLYKLIKALEYESANPDPESSPVSRFETNAQPGIEENDHQVATEDEMRTGD
jgi:aquaporin related protein